MQTWLNIEQILREVVLETLIIILHYFTPFSKINTTLLKQVIIIKLAPEPIVNLISVSIKST